jgi:hypothetical protein
VGTCWTFKDYVSASGRNEIHDWLNGLPVAAKATLNVFIQNLEATPDLKEPAMKELRGHKGVYELRQKVNNVQYRPLCCYGPARREVTILIGASKKGGVWNPPKAIDTAKTRKKVFSQVGRTCDHNFS